MLAEMTLNNGGAPREGAGFHQSKNWCKEKLTCFFMKFWVTEELNCSEIWIPRVGCLGYLFSSLNVIPSYLVRS